MLALGSRSQLVSKSPSVIQNPFRDVVRSEPIARVPHGMLRVGPLDFVAHQDRVQPIQLRLVDALDRRFPRVLDDVLFSRIAIGLGHGVAFRWNWVYTHGVFASLSYRAACFNRRPNLRTYLQTAPEGSV